MMDENKFNELFFRAEKNYLEGNLFDAESLLLELLNQKPHDAKLNELIGLVYLGQNKNKEAIKSLEIASKGASLFGQYKLAMLYMQEGAYKSAINTLLSLHQADPQSLDIIFELANACLLDGNYGMALKWLNIANSLSPNDKEILYNIGRIYDEAHDKLSAIKYYKQSLEIDSRYIKSIINIGTIFMGMKNYQGALDYYKRAFQIEPDSDYLIGDIVFCMKNLCMWSEEVYSDILNKKVASKEKVIFPFQYLAVNDSPNEQLRIAKEFSHQFESISVEAFGTEFKGKEKIKIAYVSADFKSHAMAYLMAEVFELHDRSRFEIFAFSLTPLNESDPMTLRLKNTFDQFYDLSQSTDEQIYELARKNKITIAVDLMGHTTHARTALFARRIAPAQINFLGLPGTMGAKFMDYIIADKNLIPQEYRKFYAENVIFMPHTYQPSDNQKNISNKLKSKNEVGLPQDKFVFCCFNSIYKINKEIFNAWIEILNATPNSVLWLCTDDDTVIKNLRNSFIEGNIDPARLIFSKPQPYEDYLELYKFADLFLDTIPFNAGTTARDALYCGVPVLTIEGRSFAGRMASSLLRAIDMCGLITKDLVHYKNLAVQLATRSEDFIEIKHALSAKKQSKPFSSEEYVANLESAYEKISVIASNNGEHCDLYL